jgi:Flp pilus assembly protein TadG
MRRSRIVARWRMCAHFHQRATRGCDDRWLAGESGMVVAETAIAIPLLLAVAGALIWGLSLLGTSLGMADTARQIGRDVARGVGIDAAVQGAHVPDGQDVAVQEAGDWVTVHVTRVVESPIVWLDGLSVPLEQSVTMPREWSW